MAKRTRSLFKRMQTSLAYHIFMLKGVQIPRWRSSPPPHTYDVSVILPFYKKLDEFKEVLPSNAPFFERNGIEVIIAMDEPSQETKLIDLIKTYPFINWRVIVNDVPHAWRNPVKAINVGLRHATRANVLVMSPESRFETDIIQLFSRKITARSKSFITGHVVFENSYAPRKPRPYGSLFAPREALEAIRGYDEQYTEWGADDDDIRLRLKRTGHKWRSMNDARVVHTESGNRSVKQTSPDSAQKLLDQKRSSNAVVNDRDWGRDFARVAYDYENNEYAEELCREYLHTLDDFSILKPEAFKEAHRVVALIQCYNNPDVNKVLQHVARHSDGIVLLDDYSADDTFTIAMHPKLILKSRKLRSGFNDRENRNILLNIASFIRSEWFYFIDMDERIDERFESPLEAASRPCDVPQFNLIHLWNDPQLYRVDYPYSDRGLCTRNRMFRSRGRLQIRSSKQLHVDVVPYHSDKRELSRVLLLHSGMLTAEQRERKYAFYKRADQAGDQGTYEHLVSTNPRLGNVRAIQL